MKKKRKVAKRKPAARRAAPAAATPGACFHLGAAVTESQYRAVLALSAAKAKDANAAKNELEIASYDLGTVEKLVPACRANRDAVESLKKEALGAIARKQPAQARTAILEIIRVIRTCGEKVRDRCAPEIVPIAAKATRVEEE